MSRRSASTSAWAFGSARRSTRQPIRRRLIHRRPSAFQDIEGRPVSQEVHEHILANGMTLLAERMDHVRSAALNFLVPAGCAYDPQPHVGIGSVLADLITRGAGSRDSRQLTLALDNLGLDRDESVGAMHVRFWGGTLGRSLPAALEIYAD